ncbi:MAG: Hpt domain-containing protein [Ruthenibacterium sp.]
MDAMLERLRSYGADMDGAMDRFLEDVELYKTCYTAFLQDEAFPLLGKALAQKEYETAFECAHALKGITGNMGLTPLYQVICRMVEELREQKYAGLQEGYAEIQRQLALLKKLQE